MNPLHETTKFMEEKLSGMTPSEGVTFLCEVADHIADLLGEKPGSTLPETDPDFQLPCCPEVIPLAGIDPLEGCPR